MCLFSWYNDRCRCLGINTARGRHENHTTFHMQCSERRCRMNYHSRKWQRHYRYMCVLPIRHCWEICWNCGYATAWERQLSSNPWYCVCTLVPQPAAHCRSSIVWVGETQQAPLTTLERILGLRAACKINVPALEDFVDGYQGPDRINAQVVKQANELIFSVYANKGDMFEGADLGCRTMWGLRVYSWWWILDASAIDALSQATADDAYELLWRHQWVWQKLLMSEEEHCLFA